MCNGLNATVEQEKIMTNRVPESVRRFNSAAVARRDAWRGRYHVLVEQIRRAKDQVRRQPFDRGVKIQLESLQTMAQLMNMERAIIGMDLRASSYEWV
jgi:hypothetical protein